MPPSWVFELGNEWERKKPRTSTSNMTCFEGRRADLEMKRTKRNLGAGPCSETMCGSACKQPTGPQCVVLSEVSSVPTRFFMKQDESHRDSHSLLRPNLTGDIPSPLLFSILPEATDWGSPRSGSGLRRIWIPDSGDCWGQLLRLPAPAQSWWIHGVKLRKTLHVSRWARRSSHSADGVIHSVFFQHLLACFHFLHSGKHSPQIKWNKIPFSSEG